MSVEAAGRLPMLGREDEFRAVRMALADAPGRGVLVAGAAGVGKTRLSQEAAAHLEESGWRLLHARTSGSGAGLPLAALAGLPPPPGNGAPGSSLAPVERALLGLRAFAGGPRAVLVVDDAHLLDEVSAVVVHQMVAEGSLPILATARTDEAVPDAVTALWKDAGVRRLDLRPLPASQMEALVVAAMGGPIEGRTLRRLGEAAAGNPLLLRELLASVREAGLFDRPAGIWRLAGPLDAAPRLTELLRNRLSATDPAERDALELLAVGQPLPLRVAIDVVGAELLERLERRGLVTVVTTGKRRSVWLGHPLYAELLRTTTPRPVAASSRGWPRSGRCSIWAGSTTHYGSVPSWPGRPPVTRTGPRSPPRRRRCWSTGPTTYRPRSPHLTRSR